jgi:hypothetical protein
MRDWFAHLQSMELSMRKLLLAVTVVAALVGAGWLGMRFAAPVEAAPVPEAATKTVEKRKAPKPAHVKRTWAERAGASCARALEDNRAVVRDSPYTTADARSEVEAALGLGQTLNFIEGRLLRELKAVRPSTADRRRVTETLELLTEEHRHHVALFAGIRTLSPKQFDQAIRRDERMGAALRVLFLGLGATSCAAFLDPESY